MLLNVILSFVLILSISLMLYAAVALVQKKALFSSAPKDVQAAIKERKEERFRGARIFGWKLIIISIIGIACAVFFAAYDGIRHSFTLWQFF